MCIVCATSIYCCSNQTSAIMMMISFFSFASSLIGLSYYDLSGEDGELLMDIQNAVKWFMFVDYLTINVFCILYHSRWFLLYCCGTLILFVTMFWIDGLYENQQLIPKLLDYSTMASFAFAIVYWNRYTTTQSFMMQSEATKSKDSLIKIFNNLPDAVLLVSD